MAKIVELILAQSVRGRGTEDDPVRACDELWTLDGKLVLRCDPCPTEKSGGTHYDADALRSLK